MVARVTAVLEMDATAVRPRSPSVATDTPPVAVSSGIPVSRRSESGDVPRCR